MVLGYGMVLGRGEDIFRDGRHEKGWGKLPFFRKKFKSVEGRV